MNNKIKKIVCGLSAIAIVASMGANVPVMNFNDIQASAVIDESSRAAERADNRQYHQD